MNTWANIKTYKSSLPFIKTCVREFEFVCHLPKPLKSHDCFLLNAILCISSPKKNKKKGKKYDISEPLIKLERILKRFILTN
jgi:hypothetical protein